jgi:hypothetical protein
VPPILAHARAVGLGLMRAPIIVIASFALMGSLAAQVEIRVAGYETYVVVAPVADETRAGSVSV